MGNLTRIILISRQLPGLETPSSHAPMLFRTLIHLYNKTNSRVRSTSGGRKPPRVQMAAVLRTTTMSGSLAEERSRPELTGAGRGPGQVFTVKDLRHPLPDWSLKTLVRFSSKAPFASCREALEAPSSCGEVFPDTLSSDIRVRTPWGFPLKHVIGPAIRYWMHNSGACTFQVLRDQK